MDIAIYRLPHAAGLPLPGYATPGAAAVDLLAAITDPVTIEPNTLHKVPTGLTVAVPLGYEMQIRARSGLAFNHSLTLQNGVGTIDADFRGEVCVLLRNEGTKPYTINRGDRIAQAVVAPVMQVTWKEVDNLPPTERGSGGFGSTGG